MKLWRGIADTIGPTLTASVALGAIGLTIVARANGRWVCVGIAVVVIAALMSFATVAVAWVVAAKTRVFRDALGRALMAGDQVLVTGTDAAEAAAWSRQTFGLIRSAVGESEARLFQSSHGLMSVAGANEQEVVSMQRKMERLARLTDRASALRVGVDFDSKRARDLFPLP